MDLNNEQQKYYDFVMQRAKKGKEEELKAIVMEGIKKQEQGTLKEYMDKVAPKLMFLLRPECIPEVIKAAKEAKF